MTNGKKSRKLLLIATVLTIAALASVLVVYAAVTLFSVTGGNVTVVGVTSGTVEYAVTNTGSPTWGTTLSPTGAWYAELVLGSSSTYSGPVTISWQLQTYATGSWVNVGSSPQVVTTPMSLNGGSQTIYAATDGTLASAYDWSAVATGGTYRIIATVASAP
jgi:hypothetical protein